MISKQVNFLYTIFRKKTLYYRIESKFSLPAKFQLIAYPSKKLVGKLEGKLGAIDLSVLDDKTNQRLTGTIKGHFSLVNDKYSMQFNGKQLSMQKDLLSPHMNIRDETNGGKLLARYQREFYSLVTATTYGVQVYSNDIPDGVYLLILAWTDIGKSERWIRHSVMPGLDPGIHVFLVQRQRRGWPGRARP